MPQRSKVELLPDDLRRELEQKLIGSGFSGYVALAEWLGERGFEVSKSSLQRWGSSFEERVRGLEEVTRQAQAIVERAPDKDGALTDSILRLAQEKLFKLLLDINIDPETVDIAKLMRSVSSVGRASIDQKKLAAQIRREVAEEERSRAIALIDELAEDKDLGLTREGVESFKKNLLSLGK